jgi:hypothetical protein
MHLNVTVSLAFLAAVALSTTAHAAEGVTLVDLEDGDIACYVVLQTPKGEQSLMGDFELCRGGRHDATRLIGRRVIYTTKKEKVLAQSCEGGVNCRKSDVVDLVISLTAAPN